LSLVFLTLFASISDIRPQGFSRASVLAAGLVAIAEETADDVEAALEQVAAIAADLRACLVRLRVRIILYAISYEKALSN
jgi:hypothetical protein